MKQFRLAALLLAVSIGAVVIIVVARRENKEQNLLPPEMVEVSEAFKAKRDLLLREDQAGKLLRYIKEGMNKQHVMEILGAPEDALSQQSRWVYTVGYSKTISVSYSEDASVERIERVGFDDRTVSPIERNWSLLTKGMTKTHVERMLGKPETTRDGNEWQYHDAAQGIVYSIVFDEGGRILALETNKDTGPSPGGGEQ
jgi:outer membrane protein assembly factor BamE (lipoprotein component of BamABCDE complex)